MRYFMRLVTSVVAAAVFAALANAQEVIVYPAQGQNAEQQGKDNFECYNWSKQNSGFDPMAPPTTSTAPPQSQAQQGGVARGATRGALVGVGVGAIAGGSSGAKKGLAAGALGGGLMGGMRRNDQKRQQAQAQQQWEQQEAARYQQARSTYNRAYGACMQGRGYTVS
jgi:hypothetical protein